MACAHLGEPDALPVPLALAEPALVPDLAILVPQLALPVRLAGLPPPPVLHGGPCALVQQRALAVLLAVLPRSLVLHPARAARQAGSITSWSVKREPAPSPTDSERAGVRCCLRSVVGCALSAPFGVDPAPGICALPIIKEFGAVGPEPLAVLAVEHDRAVRVIGLDTTTPPPQPESVSQCPCQSGSPPRAAACPTFPRPSGRSDSQPPSK